MRGLVVFAALLAGCYKPSVGDCEYRCGTGGACPNGLACDPSNQLCRTSKTLFGEECQAPSQDDADTGDGSGSGVDAALCNWPYLPTNFDPCAFDPEQASDVETIGTHTYSTDDEAFSIGSSPAFMTTSTPTLRIVHVDSMTIPGGTTLTITGSLPVLFIVERNLSLDGTLSVAAGENAAGLEYPGPGADRSCGTGLVSGIGGQGGPNTGGGGGGSFGDVGTAGASGPQLGGSPGLANGDPSNVPLRGGCSGGSGGGVNAAYGLGGGGGGAVQISVKGTALISGTINASGGGGHGGSQSNGGGGAGGSGGAILLEAASLNLAGSTRICANGGGGGGGALTNIDGYPGGDGDCSTTAAANGGMGRANPIDNHGGNGATVDFTATAATYNASGGTVSGGGGGGGGGVGRIRITGPRTDTNTPLISPTPM